jgi:hypothetical protein
MNVAKKQVDVSAVVSKGGTRRKSAKTCRQKSGIRTGYILHLPPFPMKLRAYHCSGNGSYNLE